MIEPSISVVIVSYRTGDVLWECLKRVFKQEGVLETILVNNGNPAEKEDQMIALSREGEHFILLTGHGNIGFGAGCNLGAKIAKGKYVIFLNPDALLTTDDALSQLAQVLESEADAWLVGGVLRNEDGSEQRASRRNLMTAKNALIEGLGLSRLLPSVFHGINIEHRSLPETPAPIPAVSGACMMMERERFMALGGFDEGYFLHVEDMDLCKRIHDAGGSVWLHPQVDILHHRSSSEASPIFVERQKMRGFIRYFRTHCRRSYGWRWLAEAAATGRYGIKILRSFFPGYH